MSAPQDISQNKALLWFMATACGLCAGANYYSQPLIHSIQQYFAVTEGQAALTVTFAQVSYALGLLFIVPMGDVVNKTKFIPLLMCLCALGLFVSAFSVNLPMLWLGTIMAGMFSVAAQILIPLATMTVNPEKTGEVVGFLMSGLLVGILLSTSLAGLFSNLFHWKMIYVVSGILMLILAYALKSRLPYVMRMKLNYGQVFVSMGQLLKQEKRLVLRALSGAFAFAAVSILFSTIALLLTAAHHLPDLMIGMVGLVGIFGALSTQYIGKYADQGYTKQLTWIGCGLFIMSWICFYFGQIYLLSYILGFALIQLALALVHTSNQSIIFRLRPDAKSRINAIYMTAYFTGGACGSALGIFSWNHGGWSMTCLVGICLVFACMLFSFLDNRISAQSIQA
ncbi:MULTISPECIES: MFS transporter [Acinetobacter]|uniref:MFS transporter n=1 Tax=Acinetobacter TaxID=469 RepID=UPI00019AE5B0|nr:MULTISPECIES: MFS transporter [Acinetobacter]EEH67301.1 transporter, major facilitator family protein [Acinetobacter sp. ATCC 27244]MCU4378800.1 MFS transporter [Acinetobacter haemolyticus]NAR50717.1 MFS transporter [Acinetobacter haemolyticus]NAR52548.1 MFS transporter [Acinetobacter haemolyticus]NAR57011.1 MFS transporter [Acinetobacter haemolyticus]